MKYTDKEYIQELEDLNDIIDGLQTAEQCVYKDELDNALSDLQNAITSYIDTHKKR